MATVNALELLMLDLINAERAKVGAGPLTIDDDLTKSSEDHSLWMLQADQFSHTGVNGSSPHQRMITAGFDFEGNWTSGENIAFQSERGEPGLEDDVKDLHQSLMNSPGHRANILNPNFKEIGIGIERGDFTTGGGDFDSVMVTQNFARTDAVDAPAPTPTTPTPTPDKPDVVAKKPDDKPDKPDVDTKKPDTTPDKPKDPAKDKPDVDTKKPDTTPDKPKDPAKDKPDVDTKKPDTTDKPTDDKKKPVDVVDTPDTKKPDGDNKDGDKVADGGCDFWSEIWDKKDENGDARDEFVFIDLRGMQIDIDCDAADADVDVANDSTNDPAPNTPEAFDMAAFEDALTDFLSDYFTQYDCMTMA